MARISRPPGFDMTYRPLETQTFGPPLLARLPSFLYLAVAVALVGVVLYGSSSASNSVLFRYIVEQDSTRPLGARALAAIVFVSALAAVVRARMRGVVLHPEGLEARDSVNVGWPRVRRYTWPQIDRIVLDAGRQTIAVDLWDGRREWLPPVGERDLLAAALEQVAVARAIPISGGTGMFDPPEEEEEAG
jgi:hypothetical protein